jgi:putative DNA primase/helicase
MNGFNVEKLATCPDWVEELVKPKSKFKKAKPNINLASVNGQLTPNANTLVKTGSRNDSMFRQACRLRQTGMSYEAARTALYTLNLEQCAIPLDEFELIAVLNSAFNYENESGFEAQTDIGNAKRLYRMFGDIMRYIPEFKSFYLWDGNRWKSDADGQVVRLTKTMVEKIKEEAKTATINDDTDKAKELYRHANSSQGIARIKAAIELLQSDVPLSQSKLDTLDYLLGVKNGVVDLKTGELLPADKDNYMTKTADVEFDADAECPQWVNFLMRIMGDDEEMVEYLQKMVGYFLTGRTSEQSLYFFYGIGANGKSTFINVISQLLKDYSSQLNSDCLMVQNNSGGGAANPDIARLRGARLAVANELEEGSRLSETLVKSMTGQDTIVCRHLYQAPFEYIPTFKLVMVGNHKPYIRGTDQGIWRRIRFIEFGASIPKSEQDPWLEQKLKQELPGILNWAIEGCLKWQRDGLSVPLKVEVQTSEYQREQDIIQTWIDECCDLTDVSNPASMSADQLYQKYTFWAGDSREWQMSKRQFLQKMEDKGFKKVRHSSGMVIKGITIKGCAQYPFQTVRTGG